VSNKARNAGNSHSEPEPSPAVYEMLNGETSQPVYTTVQSAASAPASNTAAGDQSTKAVDNGRARPTTSTLYQNLAVID